MAVGDGRIDISGGRDGNGAAADRLRRRRRRACTRGSSEPASRRTSEGRGVRSTDLSRHRSVGLPVVLLAGRGDVRLSAPTTSFDRRRGRFSPNPGMMVPPGSVICLFGPKVCRRWHRGTSPAQLVVKSMAVDVPTNQPAQRARSETEMSGKTSGASARAQQQEDRRQRRQEREGRRYPEAAVVCGRAPREQPPAAPQLRASVRGPPLRHAPIAGPQLQQPQFRGADRLDNRGSEGRATTASRRRRFGLRAAPGLASTTATIAPVTERSDDRPRYERSDRPRTRQRSPSNGYRGDRPASDRSVQRSTSSDATVERSRP